MESTHALVLEVLHRASSQNLDILKPAEAQLREWETQPGFYSVLFSIISNQSLDVNVRWIAVLYMKNGIDKYWRRNSPNAIPEVEKVNIKQGLICSFNEPISQIAVQRAVIISKIARMDCPKEWPDMLPTLVQAVESPDPLIQHRSLLTLYHVIKALSTKRLAGDRKQFHDLTVNIFGFILNLWNGFSQAFIRNILQDEDVQIITPNLEKALLTLRILRKIVVFGYLKPHENPEAMAFLNSIFEMTKTVLHCRKQLKGKGIYILEICEKFIIHLTKVLLSVLDVHPFSFVSLIQPSLEFCFYYLFTDEGINFVFERFVIQCFNLIKNIYLCSEYKPVKMFELKKQQETLQAHQIKQDCLKPEGVRDICRKLVGHYFLLTEDELDTWDADPETFCNDESGDSWKYSLRPSVDTVFVTIFREYREILRPVLLEMVSETNLLVSPNDMQAILKKDAIYNAIGLCALDLFDDIDFNQWFTNTLLQELKIKHVNYRLIRRRVIHLIGHWTGIMLSASLRPTLYENINDLMRPGEDMVVRLTAANTLRFFVDDFEFSPEQFKDYMFEAFNLLFALLKEAAECETKMHILSVMALILERMGDMIQPHSEAFVQYLPHLWQESEEHNMLRSAIVATLVQVVKAMGGTTPELNRFLFPIIKLGTDKTQSAIVYLLEESLDLWLAILEYSTAMTPELMDLFNNMPALLDYNTECLRHCLIICLAQLLLAPEMVMRTHGLQLMQILDSIMGDMKNEGVIMLMRLVESFIRILPILGTETVIPILPRIFQNIYEDGSYNLVMTSYLSIVSRVLLSSHEIFIRVISNLAQSHNEAEQATLGRLLDIWLDRMRDIAQQDRRKLLALGLTNLLTTQSATVLQRFGLIMLNILETLNDITKVEEEGGPIVDTLVLVEGQNPADLSEEDESLITNHDQRKMQLILSDPVHTVVLTDYLQTQINELRNQVGMQQYQLLLHSVDADTLSQMKDYIQLQ